MNYFLHGCHTLVAGIPCRVPHYRVDSTPAVFYPLYLLHIFGSLDLWIICFQGDAGVLVIFFPRNVPGNWQD
jgi:hypothetical protein